MTVSAIIPTYRRNDLLLDRSLASVLRQTLPVDEIIVVADGMVGSMLWDLEDGLGARNADGRIRFVNIERPEYPQHPGDFWLVQGWKARNTGLDMATGDWIAPLDDDDEWTDDHIEILLGAATDEVDFVYGRAVTPWGQWYGHWPPSASNFTDGSQIYRRSLGYRYDPECMSRWLAADGDLWNRMVEGGVRFKFVDKLVHKYWPAPR